MNIFIKSRLLRILSSDEAPELQSTVFNSYYNAQTDYIRFYELSGDVLIVGADVAIIERFMIYAFTEKKKKYTSVTFVVNDKKAAKKVVKRHFTLINAGGGVVYHKKDKHKVLLMKRLGRWDLPKGKADKGESFRQTAAREVAEECNIEVQVKRKICTTWHTYRLLDKRILKCTKWYEMVCTNDKKMRPQEEEGIEELRWMSREEVQVAMENSYESIRYVLRQAGELPPRQAVPTSVD